jgi:hypothetical protein
MSEPILGESWTGTNARDQTWRVALRRFKSSTGTEFDEWRVEGPGFRSGNLATRDEADDLLTDQCGLMIALLRPDPAFREIVGPEQPADR